MYGTIVDILLLLRHELSLDAEKKLGEFIAYLWDAGLEIGHSVRSLQETLERGRDEKRHADGKSKATQAGNFNFCWNLGGFQRRLHLGFKRILGGFQRRGNLW